MISYAAPIDGLPPQTTLHTGRAIFTNAYAVIPRGVMTDIVTSILPGCTGSANSTSPPPVGRCPRPS